jgi:hypothetical protein
MTENPSVTPDGTPLTDPDSVGNADRPIIGGDAATLPAAAPQEGGDVGAGDDSGDPGVAAGERQP